MVAVSVVQGVCLFIAFSIAHVQRSISLRAVDSTTRIALTSYLHTVTTALENKQRIKNTLYSHYRST